MKRLLTALKSIDGPLLGITLLLVCFGFATLFSITINQTSPDYLRLYKQIAFGLVGLIFIISFLFIDYRVLQSYDTWILIAAVILLVSVLFFGVEIRGTKGWFSFAGLSWQPVEICKILYIIWLSSYIHKHYRQIITLRDIMITGAVTAVFVGMVLLQPDFGSGVLFIGVWIGALLVLRIPVRYIISLSVLGCVALLVAWNFVFADYQKERIKTLFQPTADPLGSGYNVTQSIIAVGSGQAFGRGLALGPQSQLNFLPERETDFIFAVVAEELGFFGASLILRLLAALLYKIYRIAVNSPTAFGSILAINLASIIFLQVIINVGMNVGLLPVTGIPLPFLSAGGSALVADLVAIGLLQNISQKNRTIMS